MAESKRILCVGRMQPVMDGVLRKLRDAGFEAEGAIDDDAVVALATSSAFDALVIGGGVAADEADEVSERVLAIQPHVVVIRISRGPGSVLEEVRAALG